MTTQHIETLIIGAGQAGLSTGYHLQRLGHPFLIVDGNERVGDNWRQQ
jgi:putative flavoprotein involved in K+ transport